MAFKGQKCSKTHLRAFTVSQIFPGVTPPDPRVRGGREGMGYGREEKGVGEGREREERGRGRGGAGEGKGGGEGVIRPPITKSWIRHCMQT
jgi:hypothetical protein